MTGARDKEPMLRRFSFWAISAIALGVLLLAYSLLSYLVFSRPRPSGDELTDALLLERWKLMRVARLKGEAVTLAQFSFATVESWEPRFKNDPRYWQLRFALRRNKPDRMAWEELERARQQGYADASSLAALYLARRLDEHWPRSEQQALLGELEKAAPDCAIPHYLKAALICDSDRKQCIEGFGAAMLQRNFACRRYFPCN
jgi:hypothetical protein